MAQKTLSVRMDDELKERAEKLFADLGMNMSTAINIFIRQSVDYGGIPFEIIRRDGFYSEHNQKILSRSIAQLDAGRGTQRELIEVDDD